MIETNIHIKHWLMEFCVLESIVHYFTLKGAHQKNGVVKIMNRTLPLKARCMRLNVWLVKTVNSTSFIVK